MVFQISLQETSSVLTYDNSRIGLAKLISLLFPSIRNCFICWLNLTSNEYFKSLVVLNIENHNSPRNVSVKVLALPAAAEPTLGAIKHI